MPEQSQAEVHPLTRALLLAEVRESEAEHEAGDARKFDDVEQLLDELWG
jgi:hypothetical protein